MITLALPQLVQFSVQVFTKLRARRLAMPYIEKRIAR
jgi:hypothetical protein